MMINSLLVLKKWSDAISVCGKERGGENGQNEGGFAGG
jgi:hypothetical protein